MLQLAAFAQQLNSASSETVVARAIFHQTDLPTNEVTIA